MKPQKLISKEKIAEKTYLLKYTIDPELEWKAGQYIGVGVSNTYRRSYSIFDLEKDVLTLLVDTKPGGLASQFFDRVEVGTESLILGPYGRFNIQPTKNHKVFISTGTGIAPFYPMVKEAIKEGCKITFIFGAATFDTEIAQRFFKQFIGDKFSYIQCITRNSEADIPEGHDQKIRTYFERVTSVVPTLNLDYKNTEFYICGSPKMVEDMENVLKGLEVDKIFYEKYSA